MSLDADKIRLIMHLRRSGITDNAVLSALERVPREAFVPPAFRDQAYEDTALPLSHGQTVSQPQIVALMTQALEATPRSTVLEIGTGSGYQTAVLAGLCRRVYTIEREAKLQKDALEQIEALRIRNVTARVGDGTRGWPEAAPFDRIIVTAAWEEQEPPAALIEQLAKDGIMVVPLTVPESALGGEQWLFKLHKDNDGTVTRKAMCPVRFVPLIASPPGDDGKRAEAG